MTFLEAALQILRREGKPLHFKEIADRAVAKKLLTFVGRTPEVTMQTQLTAAVKKSPGNPFVRVKPGLFGLLRYPELSEEEKRQMEGESAPAGNGREGGAPAAGTPGERARRRRRGRRGRGRGEGELGAADEAEGGELEADEDTVDEAAVAAEPSDGAPTLDEDDAEAPDTSSEDAETPAMSARSDDSEERLSAGRHDETVETRYRAMSDNGHGQHERGDAGQAGEERVEDDAAEFEAPARLNAQDEQEGPEAADSDEGEEGEGEGEDTPGLAASDEAAGGRRRRRRRRRRRGEGGTSGLEYGAEAGAGGADAGGLSPTQGWQPGVEPGMSASPDSGEAAGEEETAREGGVQPSPEAPAEAPSEGRRIMAPIDAAIEILRGQTPGRGVHVRQIADAAVRRRLVHGEAQEAWRVMRAALAAEPKERLRAGLRPRVRAAGSGLFALARRPPDMDLERAEYVFGEARRALRERTLASLEQRLGELQGGAFEALARVLLQREGFGPATFVKRVEGTVYLEALRGRGWRPSRCLIALRPGNQAAGRRTIGELRAGVRARNLDEGVLLLAGRLSEEAIAEWKQSGPPIEVADGPALADVCVRHGVGVINANVSVDFVDADFFAELSEG